MSRAQRERLSGTRARSGWALCRELLVLMMVASVGTVVTAEDSVVRVERRPFGKTGLGTPVEEFVLSNAHGVRAHVITLGATLTQLHMPDREGKVADVVLGFDDVAGYESERNQYIGCTTGRICGRIAHGRFELDDKTYRLYINNGPHHLHGGGPRSLEKVVWRGEQVPHELGGAVKFTYHSPHLEENYPGNLLIEVTYILTADNDLRLEYRAITDQRTPVNLTNHSYFNLAGAGTPSVLDHELTLQASRYTPTDDLMIPTGEWAPVAGTPLDFTQTEVVGKRIGAYTDSPFMGYDHNYVVDRDDAAAGEVREVARLRHPESGRQLTILSDQPGLQLYTGNFLFGQIGKQRENYPQHSALCLESQQHPDSVNQPDWPSIILSPGEEYRQTTLFRLSSE